MIYNVVLNSIRYNFYIASILNKYLKKRTSLKIKILLLSSITQLLYLEFKNYAVTNDTVEIAKIIKLNPGLINSLLKNVIRDYKIIDKYEISQSSVPKWFLEELYKNKIQLVDILKDISKEPSLHIVFKNKNYLASFKEEYINTSENSVFLKEKKKIEKIEGYHEGSWWVQDFSSMLPISLSPEIRSKEIIDMCSAPGGKAFQAISLSSNVILNDISVKRLEILRENLKRLSLKAEIFNLNALNLPEEKKYDVAILDSPCSGVGTLRRNPEILFKKNSPNLSELNQIQNNLINKASKLLKPKGILIYMVCSFFYSETKAIKENFLIHNKNFIHSKFNLEQKNQLNKFIDVDGDIFCVPSQHNGYMIDGFYGTKFIKND
jgi:16S rRNA (cytosine967-C5)-methyltransferase